MLDQRIADYIAARNQSEPSIHKEWCPNCPLRPHTALPTMRDLALATCQKYGLRLDEFYSDRRTRRIAIPRQEFMALAYELPHTSYPMIAQHLGMKDHTSVLHGVRAHKKRIAEAQP